MSAVRLIGGVFPLPEALHEGTAYPPLVDPKSILLVNGRSAIDYLLRTIGAERIWLPSFICASVVAAAGRVEKRWYDVGDALAPVDDRWLDDVRQGDLVLFVNYFGWRLATRWYEAVAERGAHILEDSSQSMVTSNIGQGAHFNLIVPRKFVGVPDGAILTASAPGTLGRTELTAPPQAWWRTAWSANAGRQACDRGEAGGGWYEAFREAEDHQPLGAFAMSDFSGKLLASAFDFGTMAARRRRNYLRLESGLGRRALLGALPGDVVPLGFPIRLAERDLRRSKLIDQGIFPPIHWEVAGIVPDRFHDSHRLSQEIMTLPCDQRYNELDMDRIVEALEQ